MKKNIAKIWFQPYTPLIFLLILGFALYRFVYPSFQSAIGSDNAVQTISITPSAGVLGDQTAIINAVSKLIRLPNDEQPQVITITGVEQFQDQPFFKQAKNGDILIIYQKNRKAILYDPLQNIILDTAPIAASESSQPKATTSSTPNF